MGSLTDNCEKYVLDHLFKTTLFTPPTTVYIGLSTADPTDAGSGWADPTYTGYARKAISFGAAGGTRVIAQNAQVTFDQCTNGTSVVTHWGLWNAVAGGTLMAYGTLSANKTIVTGNTPSIASGQVTVTFSAGGIFTAFSSTVLDWLFRAQACAQPTNVKIGLSTSIPTDGGPNITEPGGNYAQVTFNTWNAGSGSPTLVDNNGAITFGTPDSSWGNIKYAVVYKDATEMFYGDITDQDVGSGDTVQFDSGALDVTLD
jgi:hypothetical protein